MSFASPVFLWLFLPATLLVYWLLPRTARTAVLAVASLVFYAWGAGAFVLLLLACIVGNFVAGIAMDSERLSGRPAVRRAVLLSAVLLDLGILGVWKYGTFVQEQVTGLDRALGGPGFHVVAIALPIGISFFTFHHLSYVIDVYRHSRPAQRSVVRFVTYIAMFPQLIAGPIVRYHEISEQLEEVRHNRLDDFAAGFPRFALGLAKKVVVADAVGPVATVLFDGHVSQLSTGGAWLGALAYTLQIYFDFSGYSDMAIGLGRMFGFRLPENFARPYSAVSITDFWRRWHMSLSRWFRDYLYIPLGGNRGGALKTYRNLFTVFILVGFWHGAAWTFLIWGFYHGVLLVLERLTGIAKVPADRWQVPRRAVTFLLVVVGWVPFRANGLGRAADILDRMFVPHGGGLPPEAHFALTNQRIVIFALAMLVVLLPGTFVMGKALDAGRTRLVSLARYAYMGVAAPYAALLVAAGTFSPFLYFKF